MPALPWPAYLDALEAWTRRAETAIRGGDEPLVALDLEPDGALPADQAVRARALLDRMHQLEEIGARRRSELERARTYERD